MRIASGKLTNDPTIAGQSAGYYSSAQFPGPIVEIGARWTFLPRGGTPGTMALIISRTALGHPFSVHLVITPTFWSLGVWPPDGEGPNELQILEFEPLPVELAQDGTTVYESRIRVDGPTIEILLPQRQRRIITDDRFADWAGSVASFESFSDKGLTDSRAAFTEIWARSA